MFPYFFSVSPVQVALNISPCFNAEVIVVFTYKQVFYAEIKWISMKGQKKNNPTLTLNRIPAFLLIYSNIKLNKTVIWILL
jgi:hypothetical protein